MVHIQPSNGLAATENSTTATATTVRLDELLSTCVDACLIGCAEIRAVQRRRHESAGSSASFLKTVELKDASDPKSALTQADGAAQAAIIHALIRTWGHGLEIVGEEDEQEDEELLASTGNDEGSLLLRRDLCRKLVVNHDDSDADDACDSLTVPLKDVTVFVDPLDGTREYVEERLSNCQTLIGIAYKGTPVAGAMGIPFPDGTLDLEPTVVYGLVGSGHGVFGTPLRKSNAAYDSLSRPLVASGDSKAPVMVTGRQVALLAAVVGDDNRNSAGGGSNVLYGGAGNKLLATAAGHVDATIQHKFGGPWDTCAPEAVLKAMGGRITTWTGEDLVVTRKDAPSYECDLGFVATGAMSCIDHDKLVALLSESSMVQDYQESVKNS